MKNVSLFLLAGLLVLAVNIQEAHAGDTYWYIYTIDSIGDVGFYTSIALDSNDKPHISYFDSTNVDVKYAHYDGSWHTEIVDDSFGAGQNGISLALDSKGIPHISYSCSEGLKYAYYDEIWHIETVDANANTGWFRASNKMRYI
ncbi:MAG: hypothetical protein JW749_04475 [Sedimentisphaerales bacterium]|nr:hypothetical protein [Sedimentisphaerales bacterium]